MVTKFHQSKKKQLVCCVVDNLDLYSSGWAREISVNITDYMLHRFIQKGYDVLISKDENALLKVASEEGYTHAVVIATGMSLGLSDRIFPALDNLCKQDFFIAGHILERNENSYWKNGYYEMHHQFYVVRLLDYTELGCPFVGQQEEGKHTQIAPLRSSECLYNDHEVASWIKPGTVEKEYDMKCHGWHIIASALSHDKTIIDLGPDIRANKKYLYYEHDHVFLRQMGDIYYNQFFCNNFTPTWNSDNLQDSIAIAGPVDQYITVGIGVYWVSNLVKIGVTPDTKVIFTDINHNTLKFMKALVEEWDGNDYTEFYRKHLPIMPNNLNRDVDAYIDGTKKDWDAFVSKFDNWPEVWAQISALTFEYVLIDYMSSYNLDWIEPGKNTMINLSDMFTHSPYIATQSLKYRVSCENKLFNTLKAIDPNIHIMMNTRAADGFYSSQEYTGPVGSFKLTDINLLNKPSWHSVDWVSPRMLG